MPGWPIPASLAPMWRKTVARSAKRLEGDDRAGVLDAGDHLHSLIDEMADVGRVLDIELDQQVEIAGRRVDFRGDLGVGQRVRHLTGFAEMSFDLHEKRTHPALPRLPRSIQQNHAPLARSAGA